MPQFSSPWEEPKRLIPQVVSLGLDARLPPFADPATARDYVYVDDVCDAYVLAARSVREPGAIFNIGTGVQTTLEQVAELARRVFDIEAQPAWGSMPSRTWDTSCWVADVSRARVELGWTPSTSLEEGLRLTADWLRSHPELENRYRVASC